MLTLVIHKIVFDCTCPSEVEQHRLLNIPEEKETSTDVAEFRVTETLSLLTSSSLEAALNQGVMFSSST